MQVRADSAGALADARAHMLIANRADRQTGGRQTDGQFDRQPDSRRGGEVGRDERGGGGGGEARGRRTKGPATVVVGFASVRAGFGARVRMRMGRRANELFESERRRRSNY